jgi:hypothetical protein
MRECRHACRRTLTHCHELSRTEPSIESRQIIEMPRSTSHLAKVDVEGSNPFSRSAKYVGSPWYREAL